MNPREPHTLTSAIELDDVNYTYQGIERQTHALRDISFTIASGEPVAIIGPSGCGKTTILSLIAGLIAPDSGKVLVNGTSITGPRHHTSLILQDYGLLPWKTVIDNAALGLTLRGTTRAEARATALEALHTVGLEEFAKAYPNELSGGMRQRLALARALALEVDIMLMDEPLSALDALTREELQDVLLKLWQRQSYAQVLVTHSIEEAVFLGRTILLMTPRPGRIRTIIKNPSMGSSQYRQTAEFYEKCACLRKLLIEENGRARLAEIGQPYEDGDDEIALMMAGELVDA
ncbi:MAG: ABC transporter ATP-binding protein [Coriobacteriia bacterium]|nr:ABC transporter ATP-binding protein [Coriobacteriia bacterium]